MIRVFSYGGGVQSTADLVLAAQARIDYKTFLFCNVGEDSENPETMKFLREYAIPYAVTKGINLFELYHTCYGEQVTLYQQLTKPGSRTIGIPIRMSNGAPGNRSCTLDFKIRVVDRYLKKETLAVAYGATVGLGISLDEWQRMRTDSGETWKKLDYPLIDLRLTRRDCVNIIRDAGLPIPPKSSCWFCPFHSLRAWQEMRQEQPELFQKACELEALLNERRETLGRDKVWFTRKLKPLTQVTTDYIQDSLFADDTCESGYCMV